MSDTGQDAHEEVIPPPTSPPAPRKRYPIIYISYQVWVEHEILFPDGTPRYARHAEDPRTPENWKYHHECLTSDDPDVEPFPPCEVPFKHMSIWDFKRSVLELVGATRSDFDFTRVLVAAESNRKIQWRGYRNWPGGPIATRKIDVARNFNQYARMAANAVRPKKCHLRLFMEDPMQRLGNPLYWTRIPHRWPDEVWTRFEPNGAPPPPSEECIVLEVMRPGSRVISRGSTLEPVHNSASSWVIETPSSSFSSVASPVLSFKLGAIILWHGAAVLYWFKLRGTGGRRPTLQPEQRGGR
ncbi:uncharacterized protein PGTG_15633 [Puccinia graminis f. sp. tritici CRL 75-36-700-3]|uniref:Uncharacterized protein n=1 Tax=Puccinia graminis f. sp. tritici (strain CRL 75-36-700-3 / race SCCL) TaxID=418459 RepID=E3KZE5_PUCGT|nr:uncharacterized protein PGTG_15633 [Puccinia graminis f. sp. tritici CRL 75-36-700-3]EFP89670.2 hypothetical protein PGTG_15633 [Puccinia graminis f. sp. tritici CRL 75-36-700-3]